MKWSESDVDDLRKFHARGMTDAAIAKMLDRGEDSIASKRQRLALTHRRNFAAARTTAKVWTPGRRAELAKLHEDGWTDGALATRYACTPRAVAVQRAKQGAVAFRCAPKRSVNDYQACTLIAALRAKGLEVTIRRITQ